MKPSAFHYATPGSVDEALDMLRRGGADCRIIAGGQSLVPTMNFRLAKPDALIDINHIEALQFIREDAKSIEFGAVTRHAQFHKPICSGPLGHLLAKVVRNIAHYPIRQRGTFGGSLSHADPASEWCLVATTMDATLTLQSLQGRREVAGSDFVQGTFTTAMEPEEILHHISMPKLSESWGTGFIEFSRRKGDFALAMALVALQIEGDRIVDARVGLGAISDHSQRMTALEAALIGQRPGTKLFEDVGRLASELVEPSSDPHASASYRLELTRTVLTRALAEAVAETGYAARG